MKVKFQIEPYEWVTAEEAKALIQHLRKELTDSLERNRRLAHALKKIMDETFHNSRCVDQMSCVCAEAFAEEALHEYGSICIAANQIASAIRSLKP